MLAGVMLAGLLAGLLPGCGGESAPPAQVDGRTQAEWEADLAGDVAADQVVALGALSRFESPPIEAFSSRLEHEQAAVRAAAIRALGTAGPEAAKWAPDLAIYLEEDAPGFEPSDCKLIRDAAMVTLGKIGPEAFPTIAHLLMSRDARHRARAAYTIRPFVADLQDGTKVLLPLVEDKSWIVRREAVRGLGLAGAGDERAAEALLVALADDNAEVVRYAALAVGGIGGRSDREGRALAELLFAHQTGVRAAAAYGLGLMGEEASPFADRLLDLLQNDSKRVVRIQAARAHWLVSGDAGPGLEELHKGIQCDDPGLCRDALKALAALGPAAEPAVPVLVGMLSRSELRHLAVVVLGAIGPAAKDAVPKLESVAQEVADEDPDLAAEIGRALASIGQA